MGKLDRVKDASLAFNKETFGSINIRKKRVERRLQGVKRELELWEHESIIRLEKMLRHEYEQILLQEEMMWYQKSRERWVKFGDRNTKFFHTQTIIRRKRNKIHDMFIGDNVWCTEDEALKVEAQIFFTNLFAI